MSKSKMKKMSVDDISLFKDDKDVDFAIGEVYCLAEGNNSHHNPIDIEVLKRDAHTMLGKFLIADYSKFDKDVTGHTENQRIIGYVPKESKIQFKEKDGKEFVVFEVLISKLYATSVYMLFKDKNFRNVSAEFSAMEGDEDEKGDTPILAINFHGITILGLSYQPSCEGAEMSIKQFSANDADEFYHSRTLSELERFSEERRNKMAKTYKVNKTELKETPWGDVDKTSLRNTIMDASNRDSLVKDVYALVENGWEDAPSEHLKYPIMELSGDTFYYNRYGLSAALAYAKQENETGVISKVKKLYKKFKIDEEGDNVKKKEFSAVNIGDMWGKIWDKLAVKYPDNDYGSIYRIEGVYEEDNQKFAVLVKKDETQLYRLDFSLSEEGLEFSDELVEVEQSFVESDVVRKFEDVDGVEKYQKFEDDKKDIDKADENDEPDDKKDVKDGEGDDDDAEEFEKNKKKKMSLDVNAYAGAMLAMLKAETAEERDEAMKLGMTESEDGNIVMQKICDMCNKMADLTEFQDKTRAKDTELSIKQTLASVKQDLSKEKYAEIEEKSKSVNFENVEHFKQEVKAFAYDNRIDKTRSNNDGIIRTGYDFSSFESNETENVFDRILSK